MGTIIIWASSIMPTQGTWLECNGQSTVGFPELANVVGANVPDYRGVFLRGLGSQTSTHYGTVTHSSASLGILQGDAIRNITGTGGAHQGGSYFNGAFASERNFGAYSGGGLTQVIGNFNASRVVSTANENRPVNRAVIYLIKAG